MAGGAESDQAVASFDGDKNVRLSLRHDCIKTSTTPSRRTGEEADASSVLSIDARQSSHKLSRALKLTMDELALPSLETLKAQLSLHDRYCRAPTQRNTPCRIPSPVRNKSEIALKLSTLRAMTQSSDELVSSLEDLARLVHCHLHDYGHPSDARVDNWIASFPKKEGSQQSQTVLSRKIKQALGGVSSQCGGRTKAGKQCSKHVGGQKVENRRKTIAEILEMDDHSYKTKLQLYLSVFEVNRYCHLHISQQSMRNVDRWLRDLLVIRDEHSHADTPGPASSALPGTTRCSSPFQLGTTRALEARVEKLLQDKCRSKTKSTSDSLPWSSDTLDQFWPVEADTTPLQIISNRDVDVYHQSLNPSVSKVAAMPLEPEEQKAGYVYAYEVENNPGLVKIGFTTRAINVRHKEWTDDCNRKVKLLYPLELDQLERIPNARRVEALCHAELDNCRLRILCHGCVKQHVEWFKVATKNAIIVIRRWTLWMKTEPYPKSYNNTRELSSSWEQLVVNEEKFLETVPIIAGMAVSDWLPAMSHGHNGNSTL